MRVTRHQLGRIIREIKGGGRYEVNGQPFDDLAAAKKEAEFGGFEVIDTSTEEVVYEPKKLPEGLRVTRRQLRRIIRETIESGLSDRDLQYAREDEELGSGRDEWEDVSDRDLQYAREEEDLSASAWRDGDPHSAGHQDGHNGREPLQPAELDKIVNALAQERGWPAEELKQEYLAGYESGAGAR